MTEIEMKNFVEWLRGKERVKDDNVAAVATHVRDRPSGTNYQSLDHFRTCARHYGPNVSQEQITAAVAEFQRQPL